MSDSTNTCPVTGLTEKERECIKSTYTKLVGTTPDQFVHAGVTLVLWMFDNLPNMVDRFNKFDGRGSRTKLVADEMFLAHTRNVMTSLETIIHLLDDPHKLSMKLRAVVASHVKQTPPIGTEFFEPFATKFRFFLEAVLGDDVEDDEIEAWEKFLFALNSLIAAEEQEVQKRLSKASGKKWTKCCFII